MTVLYCLIQAREPLTLPPGGLPGAEPPRALPAAGSLTAIVATLPDRDYAPDVVNEKLRDMDWVSKAAVGHEQLLEAVMRSATAILPMKLLTLFSGDDRLLKDLAKQRARLTRAAAHVAGCEEYGLRIVALDAEPAAAESRRPASGTAFLERKKQVRDDARGQAARRAAFAREAFEALAGASRDAVSRPVLADDAERPLLDAAFLVAADQKAAFGRTADALGARAGREHCVFKLTGPWPPYHFVQVDHAS
ncbi:MAG TPA: GvpL/GvpF family gas vesicle protein [Vicinamibacterales bacterium]|nr:GvpL/GvpF family gas vesicle protein [Vicinamibacterales bacterium]